jgi:hypothetical protein
MRPISRRAFVAGAGAAAALAASRIEAMDALFEAPLYPPMDLSYFDTPVSPAPADIRLGYASITWAARISTPTPTSRPPAILASSCAPTSSRPTSSVRKRWPMSSRSIT